MVEFKITVTVRWLCYVFSKYSTPQTGGRPTDFYVKVIYCMKEGQHFLKLLLDGMPLGNVNGSTTLATEQQLMNGLP